jgi:AcrR family transcriptional regulator
MSPEDRRAAIVGATLPLLLTNGPAVTTRQIAEACGVAEGTIFRAFADKQALIRAAVGAAFDPAELIAELAAIDRAEPLEARLRAAVAALHERVRRIVRLVMVLNVGPPPTVDAQRASAVRNDTLILDAVAAVIEPDADALRVPVRDAAGLLWMLTFASAHPMTRTEPLPPAEIVDLVLHGVRRRSADQLGAT